MYSAHGHLESPAPCVGTLFAPALLTGWTRFGLSRAFSSFNKSSRTRVVAGFPEAGILETVLSAQNGSSGSNEYRRPPKWGSRGGRADHSWLWELNPVSPKGQAMSD
ncbi:uncharacterized protein BO96DRAFT_440709 [Aspergillus niger CBS 101883]|uniref:Uncharacterized protein n=1 Tax=Aspergillus niger ATCC 13496 TaxID=1353008 RepID=A0A370CB78_ASPNG|nr:uncharacterized protein BO96DRAFT_440709 [Aspergillus niger CBS 101883]PYH62226.1 hypothetical protein BO96DRAFT_440709 [Aspergillus niger CBS 101883]RDH25055.1 hypothetical protein M747DRAFT_366392 [Aspergillus niger ATCC 13496]